MQKTGHKALRKGRRSLPGRVYHVTVTTADRKPRFTGLTSARVVARSLNDPHVLIDAKTLAWCLMPDHLHWLVQIRQIATLSTVVQRLKSATARKLQESGSGRLWARTFHDHALRTDEDLRSIARYIVANPVRGGLVRRIGDYPYWDAIWVEN